MKTVEQRVSNTINEESTSIVIGGKEYFVAPPTWGTLVKVSEFISKMPEAMNYDSEVPLSEILDRIRNEGYAPAVLATLIVGSKDIRDNKRHIERQEVIKREIKKVVKHRFGFIPYIANDIVEIKEEKDVDMGSELEYLTEVFTHECKVSDVALALNEILQNRSDMAFFLSTTNILRGQNRTKPTKETKATALGR